MFKGPCLRLESGEDGFHRLVFDHAEQPVNTFDQATLAEFDQVLGVLEAAAGVRGLVLISAKPGFVAGADIREFQQLFLRSETEIADFVFGLNRLFCRLEDLPFPTVAAIRGAALGGGLEVALACDYRLASQDASLGLPEVKLGICPGFGGTVRLPRLIGIDNALEWICTGRHWKPEQALKVGVVDGVVAAESLQEAAVRLLAAAQAGDWQRRRQQKTTAVRLNDIERLMAFTTGKAVVAAEAGPNLPAPLTAAQSVEKSAHLIRDEALRVEANTFARLARTPQADSLVGLFLNEQDLSRRLRRLEKQARSVQRAGVLGAGIMGGGIAYQSASRGVPVLMKDIRSEALDRGMAEAAGLLSKQVERGRLSAADMGVALSAIRPTLDFGGFETLDLVVEAVVENPEVKKAVLAECEARLPEQAVLASNTSTIAITQLATALQRSERFCGMHFFNPVHRMPLVEVIRGERSSDEAVATVVSYAKRMGKTPIVVRDCPGFFVNRVLFPYFAAFNLLVRDGVPFRQIDRAMETFGWPMGPAYLLDVVGLDTAHHAAAVMAEGFPDRMRATEKTALDALFEAGRRGQKSGSGFYAYAGDTGKPQKQDDPTVDSLLAPVVSGSLSLTDEAIVERMMLPLCLEAVRCLEEGIIETPGDGDLGLIMGLGFPVFWGGVFRYLDQQGLAPTLERADALAALGPLYQPTVGLRERAVAGQRFFGQEG